MSSRIDQLRAEIQHLLQLKEGIINRANEIVLEVCRKEGRIAELEEQEARLVEQKDEDGGG